MNLSNKKHPDEFKAQAFREQLREWGEAIDEALDYADHLNTEIKGVLYREIEDLRTKLKEVQQKLHRIRSQSKAPWKTPRKEAKNVGNAL
jgi:uncharacterized coiled-coil DUF342 family protein